MLVEAFMPQKQYLLALVLVLDRTSRADLALGIIVDTSLFIDIGRCNLLGGIYSKEII
jgi:hypothetical protein